MTQEKISTFFETLKPETPLEAYATIYANDATFKDPFNEVFGIEGVYKIFEHMYATLDYPRFIIKEYLQKENIVYVQWDFIFHFKNEKEERSFEGMSRLELNVEGKVVRHTDYWDAAEHVYEKLPLLGAILRFIKRKISID